MRQQPPNREIGFVSSSFSFRVVRAGGRGEAARVRVGRYPQRWAFRELGSTCGRRPLAPIICWQACGFERFLVVFVSLGPRK